MTMEFGGIIGGQQENNTPLLNGSCDWLVNYIAFLPFKKSDVRNVLTSFHLKLFPCLIYRYLRAVEGCAICSLAGLTHLTGTWLQWT